MTKQSQCIRWVHQTVRKSNKPHLFSYNSPRETQSDAKGPPSLCFLLKYPFTSLILWEIYIRIQVPSQRTFQDGGDLVLLNEPNVFQTSGKSNVGRNYSLIRNRSFPPKSGQDPTGTNFTHNRHRFIQSSWVVCMHIWLPVFFIILR